MGYIVYDGTTKVRFDDRVLAHIEVVVISKLRRKECFALTWREPAENGSGRSTLWIGDAIPLQFRFDGSRSPSLDREWVERIAASAASGTGLVVLDEDGEPTFGVTEHTL